MQIIIGLYRSGECLQIFTKVIAWCTRALLFCILKMQFSVLKMYLNIVSTVDIATALINYGHSLFSRFKYYNVFFIRVIPLGFLHCAVTSSISSNILDWSFIQRTGIVHFQGWAGIKYEIGSDVISYISAKLLLCMKNERNHLKEEHVIQFSSITAYLRERKASALAPPF